MFWIDLFHPHSVRQHVAFAAESRVEAFHAAAFLASDKLSLPDARSGFLLVWAR